MERESERRGGQTQSSPIGGSFPSSVQDGRFGTLGEEELDGSDGANGGSVEERTLSSWIQDEMRNKLEGVRGHLVVASTFAPQSTRRSRSCVWEKRAAMWRGVSPSRRVMDKRWR